MLSRWRAQRKMRWAKVGPIHQHLTRAADEIHRSLPFPDEVPGMDMLTDDVKEWARMLDEGGIDGSRTRS